jgi:RNA polymerase sigma-70 factor, ECF subfamily
MASQPAHMAVSDGPTGSAPDSALLDGVRDGDTGALQSLVDRHWEHLVLFAARIVGSDDAAEDVVQRALIRFWERRDRWVPGSAPKLILYTMVRNLALNLLESEGARARRSADDRVPRASVATPAQVLEERELIRVMEHALANLSSRRREALVLARFHHMSHAEIAEVMGVAQRTVTNHISAALAELARAMEPFLIE